MEISPFTIYLIGILEPLNAVVGMIMVLSLVSLLIFNVFSVCSVLEDHKYKKLFKQAAIINWFVTAFLVISCILIPSQKTAAAMIIIPKVVHNEKIKECCSGLYNLAIEFVEETKRTKDKESK